MQREYHRWWSPSLNRDMELLSFGSSGANVLVFPTRTGRFFDYENWGMVEALRHKIASGHLRLFCLDSIDEESFYCFWNNPADRAKRHQEYERYILNEVLPLIEHANANPALIAHGCSLGAFHAVNLAFRHPQLFCKVVALSGRYDLTADTGTHRNLFDGHYDEDVYYNTPMHFVPNLQDYELLSRMRSMEITLAVGEQDAFVHNNRTFSDILCSKEIPHSLYVWSDEAHRPRYWRQMVQLYL